MLNYETRAKHASQILALDCAKEDSHRVGIVARWFGNCLLEEEYNRVDEPSPL